jgi:hypothetical protein
VYEPVYEEFRSVAREFVKRSVTPYADKFITSCGDSNPPHRSFTATFDTADRVVHHIRPTFSGHERSTNGCLDRAVARRYCRHQYRK